MIEISIVRISLTRLTTGKTPGNQSGSAARSLGESSVCQPSNNQTSQKPLQKSNWQRLSSSGATQRGDVEDSFIGGNPQNLVHLVIEKSGNAAYTQAQVCGSQVQPLS